VKAVAAHSHLRRDGGTLPKALLCAAEKGLENLPPKPYGF